VVVWHSGDAMVWINEDNLHRARLLQGWATVSGLNSQCRYSSPNVISHPGQLSLAIPSWVGAISTSQRAVMSCGWGVKAGMVRAWVALKL